MAEKLFGTNRHYEDAGDFTHRYFYNLRGCVAPKIKAAADVNITVQQITPKKSQRELAMDAARKKVNNRRKK